MTYLEPLDPRRLFAFGSLDATFAESTRTSHGTAEEIVAQRTLVQSDGRIVVAAWNARDWALRRYMPDGSIDQSFGDDGLFKLGRLLKRTGELSFLSEGRDGSIFVGGKGRLPKERTTPLTAQTLLVAKVKSDGTLDQRFLADGKSNVGRAGFFRVSTDSPFLDTRAESIELERGGRMVVASGSRPGEVRITRYTAEGKLDRTFARNGRLTTFDLSAVPGGILDQPGRKYLSFRYGEGITSIAEAPDGSVVAAGFYVYARGAAGEYDPDYIPAYVPYVLRISASGLVLDSQVFASGVEEVVGSPQPGLGLIPQHMEVDASGKIYMGDDEDRVRLNDDLTVDGTWSDDADGDTSAPSDGDDAADAAHLANDEDSRDAILAGIVGDLFSGAALLSDAQKPFTAQSTASLEVATAAAGATGTATLDGGGLSRDADAVVGIADSQALLHVFADAPLAAGDDDVATTTDTAAESESAGAFRVDERAELVLLDEAVLQLFGAKGKLTGTSVADEARGAADGGAVRYHAGVVGDDPAAGQRQGAGQITELLTKRVADITGALAAGRTLGSFAVRVPEPVLQTTTVAAAPVRERQHRLAPNH